MRTFSPSLGKRLATYREALSLSQVEAARRMGISAPHLSRIEGGEYAPPEELCDRMADVLGMDRDWLKVLAGLVPSDVVVLAPGQEEVARAMRYLRGG